MSAAVRQREPRQKSEKIRRDAEGRACQNCGLEDGSTVNAHCDDLEFKGIGMKSDDALTAWLCSGCHDLVDGRQGKLSKESKRGIWDMAFKRTVRQRFRLGLWAAK